MPRCLHYINPTTIVKTICGSPWVMKAQTPSYAGLAGLPATNPGSASGSWIPLGPCQPGGWRGTPRPAHLCLPCWAALRRLSQWKIWVPCPGTTLMGPGGATCSPQKLCIFTLAWLPLHLMTVSNPQDLQCCHPKARALDLSDPDSSPPWHLSKHVLRVLDLTLDNGFNLRLPFPLSLPAIPSRWGGRGQSSLGQKLPWMLGQGAEEAAGECPWLHCKCLYGPGDGVPSTSLS